MSPIRAVSIFAACDERRLICDVRVTANFGTAHFETAGRNARPFSFLLFKHFFSFAGRACFSRFDAEPFSASRDQ
jgi:hypothetical protein